MTEKRTTQRGGDSLAGLVILALAGVGLLATLFGFLAVINETDFIGGGLCLLAAAFAFGQMASALFRT